MYSNDTIFSIERIESQTIGDVDKNEVGWEKRQEAATIWEADKVVVDKIVPIEI